MDTRYLEADAYEATSCTRHHCMRLIFNSKSANTYIHQIPFSVRGQSDWKHACRYPDSFLKRYDDYSLTAHARHPKSSTNRIKLLGSEDSICEIKMNRMFSFFAPSCTSASSVANSVLLTNANVDPMQRKQSKINYSATSIEVGF